MIATLDPTLRDFVNAQSQQLINRCYTCAKCTAGCPIAYAMEYGPHRLLQMVRFGMKDAVLQSRDIWLCACCETCGTRCPNNVDIARMMDALRQMAVTERVANPANDIRDFHRLFLGISKTLGRMHEASLIVLLRVRTRDFFSDLGAGVQLMMKGKIPIVPMPIRGAGDVRRILNTKHETENANHTSEVWNLK